MLLLYYVILLKQYCVGISFVMFNVDNYLQNAVCTCVRCSIESKHIFAKFRWQFSDNSIPDWLWWNSVTSLFQ